MGSEEPKSQPKPQLEAQPPPEPQAKPKKRGRKRKLLAVVVIVGALVFAWVAFDVWRSRFFMPHDRTPLQTHINVAPLEPSAAAVGVAPCDAYVKALCDCPPEQRDGGPPATAKQKAKLRCGAARLAAADWTRVKDGLGGSVTLEELPGHCQLLVDALPRTHPDCAPR